MSENLCAVLAEAFVIFAHYLDACISVDVGHDCLYAGPAAADTSEEHKRRLVELGWFPSDEHDCWMRFL